MGIQQANKTKIEGYENEFLWYNVGLLYRIMKQMKQ